MGLFSSNYSKPGPGVDKNAPKRKGLGRFYEIYFRKFFKLIELNILYIITLLPTFAVVFLLSGMLSNKLGISMENLDAFPGMSALPEADAARLSITTDLLIRFYVSVLYTILWGNGPATAGFVYVLRCFLWEDSIFLFSDYFDHIKSNLKQSLIVWVIDLIVFIVICNSYFFYSSMPNMMYFLKYVILVLAFFYTMLHLYLWHLLVTYKLRLGELYRNSALFALSALPFSVLAIVVTVFAVLIWPAIAFTAANELMMIIFTTLTFALLFALIFSSCGLYIEHNAVTQVKKYIKEDAAVEEK